jgi:hypothetical protein
MGKLRSPAQSNKASGNEEGNEESKFVVKDC